MRDSLNIYHIQIKQKQQQQNMSIIQIYSDNKNVLILSDSNNN